MEALVLWSDDRSANLGVRALGQGTAALIRTCWPQAGVTFHNYGSGVAPVRVGDLKAALRERVTGAGGLLPWLRQFDVVVDTRAGDSFSDIYGLGRLATMSLMADQVRRAGVPLVLGPQTIGPFTSRPARILAKRSLRQASIVMARDSRSAAVAAKLGSPVDAVTTDVVFALAAPAVAPTLDVVLNVSGLLWQENPHVAAADYRRIITKLVATLRSAGRTVTLMPHVLDSPAADNDEAILPEVLAAVGDLPVRIPTSLADVRDIVGSARLTIASRMHACLNSLSAGRPTIPLAYSRKFEPLLGDLGWPHTVDLRSAPDPVAATIALADRDLAAEVPEVRRRAHARLALAVRALTEAI